MYLLVGWICARLFEVALWRALAILLGARTFFGIVETAASIINWRLFARRAAVNGFLEILRANEFPHRSYKHDDFSNYLERIKGGTEFREPLQRVAKEFRQVLQLYESQGILPGMRIHSAAETALEGYSPRERAPQISRRESR